MKNKSKAIYECREEEYALMFAALWRCPAGWQAVPFPLRGPGSVGCLGTLIGIWLFSRPPKRLVDELPRFIGRRVEETCTYIGSYGMGGPGFLGLRMAAKRRREWIIYRLWSAAEWLTINGKIVNDGLFPDERKALAEDKQASIQSLIGARLKSYTSNSEKLELEFERQDGEASSLVVRRDGEGVPVWRGNGTNKTIPENESLDDVIVVSISGRIWLT